MQKANEKLQELRTCIKDKLMDSSSNKRLKKIGIGAGAVVLVICAGIGATKYNAYNNRKPDVLIGKLYDYVSNGSYLINVDSKTDITSTFEKFGLPLSSTLNTSGTIESAGKNKCISLTLNGDMSVVLGNDKYDNTSVQIYSDGKNAYYGIGDEFTWKKASKDNVMTAADNSSQETLISLKRISEEEFKKAFSGTKVMEKKGKTVLSGKFNFADIRNQDIKDQLYVLYGMKDIDNLTGNVTIEFNGTVPVKCAIDIDAKNTTSADEMYDNADVNETEVLTGETTDIYDQMNVDEYVSDDDSLGNMVTEIKGSTTFTFENTDNDISMPDISKETESKDTSDIPLEWCALNNTINYFFIGGTK